MEMNFQFQNSHSSSQMDLMTIQQVEKDICFFYYQQSCYSGIDEDLYYGSIYGLPYWEFLNIPDIEKADAKFIQDGCLIIILAMCLEMIEGSGIYIKDHLDDCFNAISNLDVEEENSLKLVKMVRLALNIASAKEGNKEELFQALDWVHQHYVRGYFREKVKAFETNPYYNEIKSS